MENKLNANKNMPMVMDQRRKVKYSWNNGNSFDKILSLHTYFKVLWKLGNNFIQNFFSFVLITNVVIRQTEGKTPDWVLIKETRQEKSGIYIVEMILESSNQAGEKQAN